MNFWSGKKVFLTGHTGFKGAWLCLWLEALGARVTGYSLEPPTEPSLFELAKISESINTIHGDVRDFSRLKKMIDKTRPEIVIHMAAQPIVRESYRIPVETFSTNVMGTVNLLEAVRSCSSVKATVVVTTDKVYESSNAKRVMRPACRQAGNAYKESDPLGGYDPYSSSKACAELVAQAYRRSYGLNIAAARAGNVIGGGDWAADRLVPDFVRAILNGEKIRIRNPKAMRPWQYVLEPLSGYLLLAQKLYKAPAKYVGAWNFGPDKKDAKPVEWLVKKLCEGWGGGAGYSIDKGEHPHEAPYLMLNTDKARKKLDWWPRWNLATALVKIIEWTKDYESQSDMRQVCLRQIEEFNGI